MEVLRSNTVDGPEVPSTWVEFVLKKIQCWQRLKLDKGKLNVRKYDCRFSGRRMGKGAILFVLVKLFQDLVVH